MKDLPDDGHRPRGLLVFLTATVLIGLVALGLSVQTALQQRERADEREQERIEADLNICQETNDLRELVIRIGDANEDLVRGVVDVALPPDSDNGERAAAIAAIRARMDPLFAEHRAAIDEITIIDCRATTPGVSEGAP